MSKSNFIFTPCKNSNYEVAIDAQIKSASRTGAGTKSGIAKEVA